LGALLQTLQAVVVPNLEPSIIISPPSMKGKALNHFHPLTP
jgi:hypothetical protein